METNTLKMRLRKKERQNEVEELQSGGKGHR